METQEGRGSPLPGCSYEGHSNDDNKRQKSEQSQEEEGMQRFVEYIRKQGLVIVEESRLANGGNQKFREKNRDTGNLRGDNESVMTIYKNAVQPSVGGSINVRDVNKRDSSSSDEPLDTSDEIDKIEELCIQSNLIGHDGNQFVVGKEAGPTDRDAVRTATVTTTLNSLRADQLRNDQRKDNQP